MLLTPNLQRRLQVRTLLCVAERGTSLHFPGQKVIHRDLVQFYLLCFPFAVMIFCIFFIISPVVSLSPSLNTVYEQQWITGCPFLPLSVAYLTSVVSLSPLGMYLCTSSCTPPAGLVGGKWHPVIPSCSSEAVRGLCSVPPRSPPTASAHVRMCVQVLSPWSVIWYWHCFAILILNVFLS